MEIVIYGNKPFLRQKDEQFAHIQNLIDAKRQMLIDKQYKIQRISKQNEFLHDVKEDYNKHYIYIQQQKQDQVRALELLDQYIRDLTNSGSLSVNNIEDAKHEQRKIMREINSIKKGIDGIMAGLDETSESLKSNERL
jgi:Fic family protein